MFFTASADRSLYALDARTGQERARFRSTGSLTASPVTANGLTYFVAQRQLHVMEADALEYPAQYAVTRTWSQLWLWGFPLPAPPSQPGDRWRFGSDYPDDYSSRLKRTEGIISAPAVAEETLYIGDTVGKMYGVDAITGEEEWQFLAEDGIVRVARGGGRIAGFRRQIGLALRPEPGRRHGTLATATFRRRPHRPGLCGRTAAGAHGGRRAPRHRLTRPATAPYSLRRSPVRCRS